ncbi:MAG TPA: carbohydrate porin [Kofleriaceae bacterium]
MRAVAVGVSVMLLGGVARADTDPPPTSEGPKYTAPTDSPAEPDERTGRDDVKEPEGWWGGEHLTGAWGGARTWLEDRGVTIDLVYASDVFTAHGHVAALGHVDAALTLDTEKLGLWHGGTIYVIGQNNHGSVLNERDHIDSAIGVSNLEAEPYTQLTELFFEQSLFDDLVKLRIGKQDANRDFGTPRFGGNLINNNFGMFPNTPLPSYPTTGLGAIVIVQPVKWLVGKAGIYEGSPEVGGLGLDTAFRDGAGATAAALIAVTHQYGPDHRDGGTTSIGAWSQSDDDNAMMIADPARYHDNAGFFVQNDERIYLHPEDAKDPRGLTVIARYSGARHDRSSFPDYWGGSIAWHGVGSRHNDTTGAGFGYFTIAQQVGGTPGRGSEWFAEGFYKLRLTNFLSLQPDVQWFAHPGGDRRDTLVGGVRLKTKL